ncbi:hypothetical protein BT69DRAFT_642127 [Atractiella rhizophila]|nr:hypothetical protein BT69DRAFT_642127 [Atractiella rhizophila]
MLLTCQDRDAAIGRTECAHICLELMNDEAKVKHASNFWMVLKSFGYSEIQEELEGRNVHLWLQPTGEPGVYDVGARNERLVFRNHRFPRQVRITSEVPQLELPNPKYLTFHAACCQTANLSGLTDYLGWMESDHLPSSLVSMNGELTNSGGSSL